MNSQEPSIVFAIWRHRRRVVLVTIAGLVLGALLGYFFATKEPAVAEATFLIQNPSALSGASFIDANNVSRYVADQVAIIQSAEVMENAAGRVAETTGVILTVREFEKALNVAWSNNSAVATATFEHEDPEVALAATNALLETYQDLLESQANSSDSAAITLADEAIALKEDEITVLEGQLATADAVETPETARLRALADEAAQIRAAMVGASEASRAALDDRLNGITVEQNLVLALAESRPENPEVAHLERKLDQTILEQSVLIERRTDLEIEAKLNQPPTSVFSPARILENTGLPTPVRYGAALALLAFFAAAAWAYTKLLRNEVVEDSLDAETMVGAPLLAEITDFASEKLTTQLPVRDDPRSQAAEGFRFLAAATEIRLEELATRKLAVVSATTGGGKTTTAANLGLALAKQGSRVLLIDADFGNQALSKLFGVDALKVPGVTDVLAGTVPTAKAGARIPGVEGTLVIIGRGQGAAVAPSLFRSREAADFFRDLDTQFDAVVVDTPPLLQIAYSSTLASLAGNALMVLPNRAQTDEVIATATRLRSLGTEILGYAVVRVDTTSRPHVQAGSLRDVLGDSGFTTAVKSRSRG